MRRPPEPSSARPPIKRSRRRPSWWWVQAVSGASSVGLDCRTRWGPLSNCAWASAPALHQLRSAVKNLVLVGFGNIEIVSNLSCAPRLQAHETECGVAGRSSAENNRGSLLCAGAAHLYLVAVLTTRSTWTPSTYPTSTASSSSASPTSARASRSSLRLRRATSILPRISGSTHGMGM